VSSVAKKISLDMNIDIFHHLDIIRSVVSSLPAVEEYTCLGTPAFRIKKKLLARIQEDGETIAIRCQDRDLWMKANPKVFFITDHFRNYAYVLIRLSLVTKKDLATIFTNGWRDIAPKKLIKEFDAK
jgi:hypothetical protein